ncbi:MAG: DUF2064 domain-containing protein [Candidatus Omnitrophica bacterium]|nr:DUF2064 domain-containing protein [Candidatus Omnitrophota bacterium]
MKKQLIIFAREPEKGKVKTRLRAALTPEQCLRLYKLFLEDAVETARAIDCDRRIIAWSSSGAQPTGLRRMAPEFEFHQQIGSGLGDRMHNALRTFCAPHTATVITGSDSPGLPGRYICEAFTALKKNDLVLGPTRDGGYYLIGVRKPCRHLFDDVQWSSPDVLRCTLENARALGKRTAITSRWFDIDTPEDLERLREGGYGYAI